MPWFTTLRMPDGRTVEVFGDPTPREWRELEEAIDPVDGVRGQVAGEHLLAWTPPVLHEESDAELRRLVSEDLRDPWIPVRIVPALGMVTVTTTLPAREAAARRLLVRQIEAVPALRRRLGQHLKVSVDHVLEPAA
ncbi:hypothetical protein HRbin39_00177 [bacterium HR39]|nr:hypothetical protein HRbin39_00177 [bacterium HR39]